MPPSGYSQPAVSGLVVFLEETLGDLKQEVKEGKHASLLVGLTFEIDKISKAECSKDLRPCEAGVLRMTKDFYGQVLLLGEENALRQAGTNIASLHIDDKDELVRRNTFSQ